MFLYMLKKFTFTPLQGETKTGTKRSVVNLTQIFILRVITILRQTNCPNLPSTRTSKTSSPTVPSISSPFPYILFPSLPDWYQPHHTNQHINFYIKLMFNHLALTTSVPKHLFPTLLLYLQPPKSLSDFRSSVLRPAFSTDVTLVHGVSRFFKPTWLSSEVRFWSNCVTSHIICWFATAKTLESDPPSIKECRKIRATLWSKRTWMPHRRLCLCVEHLLIFKSLFLSFLLFMLIHQITSPKAKTVLLYKNTTIKFWI